jgi:hypothetical protein
VTTSAAQTSIVAATVSERTTVVSNASQTNLAPTTAASGAETTPAPTGRPMRCQHCCFFKYGISNLSQTYLKLEKKTIQCWP